MKISLWSAYLMEQSPEEMVSTFVKHGYKYTELSDEHGFELLQRGNPEKTGRALYDYAAGHGFAFPQGHLWLKADIVDPSQNHRLEIIDELKKWLELFGALDISAGVLHPGGANARAAGWSEEKIFDTRSESLRILTDFQKGRPTTITIENCGEDVDALLKITDAVESDKLAICLDTGHLNLINGDQEEFIRKCGAKLQALHIADNLGVNDDHILPYSAGTVDWQGVMSALKAIDYNKLFNFEVPGERNCPLEFRIAKLDYILNLAEFMVKRARSR
ncbi:MAG: sugar phosphate isomerase/epimerase [Victivallaceae bacterium]|nr:sugar phosphate isomerase/epimerase [Victivallaceae bacterium]